MVAPARRAFSPPSRLRTVTAAAAMALAACGGSSESPGTQPPGPPAAPGLTAFDPGPAAMTTGPRLRGTAPSGTTVAVFTDPGCAGTVGSGSAAAFASPGITVTVPAGAATALHAVAMGAGGLRSGCASLGTFTSTLPQVNPATSPPGPARTTTPLVSGSADTGAAVAVFRDAGCTEASGGGTAAAFGTSGIAATAASPDSTNEFRVVATLPGFAPSGCSTTFATYRADNTPPAPPTGGALPGPVAMTMGPQVQGSAEAGSVVAVYADVACSRTPLSVGTAERFAADGFPLNVAPGSTIPLAATATDAAGNVSSCGALGTFTSTVPAVLGTSPASPAQSTLPLVFGAADAGAAVAIYGDASCSGAPLSTGTAAEFGSPGLPVAVVADTPVALYAAATAPGFAPSGCSSVSVTYLADHTAPAAPVLVAFLPAAAAMTTGPILRGTAEASALVEVHGLADCSDAPLASGGAGAFASPGLLVTVPPGAATTLHARATDVAGNPSACATLGTFTSTMPALLASAPPSPSSSSRTPTLGGTADAGSTVALYADPACAGAVVGSGVAAGDGTFAVTVSPPLAANATTTLRARATVPGYAASGCSTASLAYTHDDAEATPTITASTPASPYVGTGTSLVLTGTTSNVEVAASTVSIFANDPSCGTAAVGSGAQAAFTGAGITVPLMSATTAYYARSSDAAGNLSTCGGPFTFTAAAPACAARAAAVQLFSDKLQGCAGAVTFPNRATLCAAGAHPCSTDEWVAGRNGVVPAHDYWVDDALRLGAGTGVCGPGACASDRCFATLGASASIACGGNNAMLVCSTTQPDPEGNSCNWTGCGHGTPAPSAFLGGCASTAGTLCCVGTTVRWVSAATGLDTNAGTLASPLRTITKALSLSAAGDTVRVLPGVYDATSGETFPLTVPAGVFLLGDEANRGTTGGAATRITATGTTAVSLGANAVLAGLWVGGSAAVSVGVTGSGVTIRNATIAGGNSGVVLATGSGHRVLLSNVTGNTNVALQVQGTASDVKVENDTFTSNLYGVVAATSSVDVGGGVLGSVGNNTLSCNTGADLYFSGAGALSADFDRWDHIPPTFSSTTSTGGIDTYANAGSVVTTGSALGSPYCP